MWPAHCLIDVHCLDCLSIGVNDLGQRWWEGEEVEQEAEVRGGGKVRGGEDTILTSRGFPSNNATRLCHSWTL